MRNGLFGMILTGISLPSFAFNNPNIEFINQVSCKMGGCTMVCVSADGKKKSKQRGSTAQRSLLIRVVLSSTPCRRLPKNTSDFTSRN
ncbi:hypothetical protein QWZ16_24550 [Vibrio ostreicida]|uniref:Secreted protein n=1 Tax=Vibrio ostreicida TaxID=526588 RepID=A0ABT8C290_9VIBR|nr:hypothetical protein [Vibrio ostreicida]MDN3612739.1 hypothetical protein [Vibrio ostreicida]